MIVGKYNGLELDSIQAFKSASLDIIKSYCLENDIDEKNIHPLTWDDILQELALQLYIPNNSFFKTDDMLKNQYNYDKVYQLFMYVYRPLCNKHNMTLDITDFCIMSNISRQTIYNISVDKLTCNSFDSDKNTLSEIIMDLSEKSYESALKGSTQHMRFLPTLNKRFGYAMQGSPMQQPKQALTTRENVVQIDGKNKPLLPPVDNSVDN